MENLAEEIYENYLKLRSKDYSISDNEAKLMKIRAEFENSLSLSQRLMFEEIDFISNKLKHNKNLELINFALNQTKKEDI